MNGKMILVLIVCMAGIVLLSVMAAVLLSRFLKQRQKRKEEGKDLLYRRVSAAREIVAPDGIDPNPLSYFVLNDAGHDIYIRCFTIDALPKRTAFAVTFPALFNYSLFRKVFPVLI